MKRRGGVGMVGGTGADLVGGGTNIDLFNEKLLNTAGKFAIARPPKIFSSIYPCGRRWLGN